MYYTTCKTGQISLHSDDIEITADATGS